MVRFSLRHMFVDQLNQLKLERLEPGNQFSHPFTGGFRATCPHETHFSDRNLSEVERDITTPAFLNIGRALSLPFRMKLFVNRVQVETQTYLAQIKTLGKLCESQP